MYERYDKGRTAYHILAGCSRNDKPFEVQSISVIQSFVVLLIESIQLKILETLCLTTLKSVYTVQLSTVNVRSVLFVKTINFLINFTCCDLFLADRRTWTKFRKRNE